MNWLNRLFDNISKDKAKFLTAEVDDSVPGFGNEPVFSMLCLDEQGVHTIIPIPLIGLKEQGITSMN